MVIKINSSTDSNLKIKEDLLYSSLIAFLYDIKIFQGGTALSSTLRRHSKIKNFLLRKQKERLDHIESIYFSSDGSLDLEALDDLVDSIDKN